MHKYIFKSIYYLPIAQKYYFFNCLSKSGTFIKKNAFWFPFLNNFYNQNVRVDMMYCNLIIRKSEAFFCFY